jgi:hypothetical protein
MKWRSMNIEGGRRFDGQEVKFEDAKSGVGKDFPIGIRSRGKSAHYFTNITKFMFCLSNCEPFPFSPPLKMAYW